MSTWLEGPGSAVLFLMVPRGPQHFQAYPILYTRKSGLLNEARGMKSPWVGAVTGRGAQGSQSCQGCRNMGIA